MISYSSDLSNALEIVFPNKTYLSCYFHYSNKYQKNFKSPKEILMLQFKTQNNINII